MEKMRTEFDCYLLLIPLKQRGVSCSANGIETIGRETSSWSTHALIQLPDGRLLHHEVGPH